jgi:hypothetical protein
MAYWQCIPRIRSSLKLTSPHHSNSIIVIVVYWFFCTFLCLFNLSLLLTFFNALYTIIFSCYCMLAIFPNFMWDKKYVYLANLVFCNPFTLFPVIQDYMLRPIVTYPWILLCFSRWILKFQFFILTLHWILDAIAFGELSNF